MNRRTALAASVSTVMVLGSATVAGLTLAGSSDRGDEIGELTIGRRTTETIVKDEYVDDLVYETSGAAPPADIPLTPPESSTVPAGEPTTGAEVSTAADPAPGAWSAAMAGPNPEPAPGSLGGVPTAAPAPEDGQTAPRPPSTPTTTSAPPTTWPPGTELPESWPAGTPYPPMPAGCREPHLEDDGRWNCEH